MMTTSKQSIVAAAALATGILVALFRYISFPDLKVESNWGNFLFINITLISTNLLAAVPGLILLKRQQINHSIAITLCGVIIGYVIAIIFGIIIMPFAAWAWSLTTILALLISYLGSDLAFNGRKNQ